jgi:glutamine amidotransferase
VSASIVVLDYEMSNLRSAVKALERLGASVRVARSGDEVGRPNAVVLPGVGHFGEAMRRISAAGFVPTVRAAADEGVAVLGICLGMQLLFEGSEESPGVAGIGLLPGGSRRLVAERKLPQIGWNTVEWADGPLAPDDGEDAHGRTYYFVHSYAVEPDDPAAVMGVADYGGRFCAAAGVGRVMGVQFHPEKSSDAGLGLLARWLERVATTAPVA